MAKKLFAPFGELGTRFRHKTRTDPFFGASLKIMGLYFIVGAVIFVLLGWLLGYLARQQFYQVALSQNGAPVEQAMVQLERVLIYERVFMLLCFGIAAYFLTMIVMRPIKKSSELQKRFAAIVSHELRTPVAIMKNSAEVALRKKSNLTLEKATEIIESNLEETNRLSEIIEFLLTFTALKDHGVEFETLNTISFSSILESMFPQLQKIGNEHGVNVKLAIGGPVRIRGNETALKGMVLNLVRNAIVHSKPSSAVSITVESDAGQARLSVRDTGSGIDTRDVPYIFEPFYKGESNSENPASRRGVGLGLSIVKEIAELHRAVILVDSVKGKGTVFTVIFPQP